MPADVPVLSGVFVAAIVEIVDGEAVIAELAPDLIEDEVIMSIVVADSKLVL